MTVLLQRGQAILGTFTLPSGQSAPGELRLKGSALSLLLFSENKLTDFADGSCVKGISYRGEHLTLIDCVPISATQSGLRAAARHHVDVFPHYVAAGRAHLDPLERCIKAIHFTCSDLATLCYDFDAFGSVMDAKSIIDVVVEERRKMRPVNTGEDPIVLYFTGKDRIAEVATAIGTISVHHRPRVTTGGPAGVSMKNRIVVTIEPEQPVAFKDAVDRMHVAAAFLSMAAGRAQGISHVHVTTLEVEDHIPTALTICVSFGWRASKHEPHKPHPADVPLDPIHRASEFETVLHNWISRHETWRLSRTRYLDRLRKGNKYDSDRIVAAANMFDILPPEAVPAPASRSESLDTALSECEKIVESRLEGEERGDALSALGRIGGSSLPKKVAHRASIVESKLGSTFPHLKDVAKIAVKVRNYFVHGSNPILYRKVEALVPFLTDTLEFTFAASDFIEADWDAQRWNSEPHGWGHTFARFRHRYSEQEADLRRALGKAEW